MLLERYPNNPILTKNSNNQWESGSVFNPNVIYKDNIFHMFYRATNDTKEGIEGGYISSIGHATSKDGVFFEREEKPLVSPTEYYEIGLGCEDPRAVFIKGEYYIFYTAVEGFDKKSRKVRIALATSKDLKSVTKQGIVGPKGSRTKAATLFPDRINNKYFMIYTWEADNPQSTIMSIQFNSLNEIIKQPKGIYGENLEHYDDNFLLQPLCGSIRGPEVGATPVKTDKGWLLIYCGAALDSKVWTIDAMLLDVNNPKKILGYSPKPILYPETNQELNGVVNNVTFPSGAVIVNEKLYVYYGSGDQGGCLATCNLNDLLEYLLNNPPSKNVLGKQYYRQLNY